MKKIAKCTVLCMIVLAFLLSLTACGDTAKPEAQAAPASEPTTAAAETAPESAAIEYPTKGINFIIPYSAGGGTDSLLRLVCSAVEGELGQSIVVSNVAGGGGQVGVTQLFDSAADGYNLGAVTNVDHYVTILNGENVAYGIDSLKYIASVNTSCDVLMVNTSTGITTIEEFVAYAKDHPGEMTVGVSGQVHVVDMGKLASAAGIEVTTIMHDGAGDSFSACLGAQVDALVIDKKFVAQAEGQELTVLASFGGERLDVISEVPTLKELGYDISSFSCRLIMAPGDTPDEIVKILSDAIHKVTDTPEFQAKLTEMSEVYKFIGCDELPGVVQDEYNSLKALLEENPGLLG